MGFGFVDVGRIDGLIETDTGAVGVSKLKEGVADVDLFETSLVSFGTGLVLPEM